MTNREKYKDPEERAKMFCEFCSSQKSCGECQLNNIYALPSACAFTWEDLEYKDELLPCPFCGGEANVFNKLCNSDSHPTLYSVMCMECRSDTKDFFTADEAIEQWNRRVK